MAISLFAGTITQYYRQTTHIHACHSGLAEDQLAVFSLDEDVRLWQTAMTEGLANDLEEPLIWQESNTKPSKFISLEQSQYMALMLCAVYLTRDHLMLPSALPKKLNLDKNYQNDFTQDGHSCFPTILRPTFWLPNYFDFTFSGQNVVHEEVMIGSVVHLKHELQSLKALISQAILAAEMPSREILKFASQAIDAYTAAVTFSEQSSVPIVLSDSTMSAGIM